MEHLSDITILYYIIYIHYYDSYCFLFLDNLTNLTDYSTFIFIYRSQFKISTNKISIICLSNKIPIK